MTNDKRNIEKILPLEPRTQDDSPEECVTIEDRVVKELNKLHAIVKIDQTFILTFRKNPVYGGIDFALESRASFKLYYENEEVVCSDDKKRTKADIFLKHPRANKYAGIVFDPSAIGPVNNCLNLWLGFAIPPDPNASCSLYLQHLFEVICSKNQKSYDYVLRWLAYVVQFPDQVHTALVITGEPGVGKNTFIDPLASIFGPHFIKLSNIHELFHKFNYYMKNGNYQGTRL